MLLIHTEEKQKEIEELELIPTIQEELEISQQILLLAHKEMREHGHCTGTERDTQGRMCLIGAIDTAAKSLGFKYDDDDYQEAITRLLNIVKNNRASAQGGIVYYNDYVLAKFDSVVAENKALKALRAAAK